MVIEEELLMLMAMKLTRSGIDDAGGGLVTMEKRSRFVAVLS